MKNANHKFKRVISKRKYSRIFESNLDKAGFAYITRNWETDRSLSAVKVGDIVYAEFPTKNRKQNRLETYCVRYKVTEDYSEDFVAFSPFPIKLF